MERKVAVKRSMFELTGILSLWCLLSPVLALPFYEKLLFFPEVGDPAKSLSAYADKPESFSHSSKQVTFRTEEGNTLSGWLFQLDESAPVALVSHGNAGNLGHRAILASALLKAGYGVFLYDYSGYGKSLGKPSIKGVVKDAIAAYDYLINIEKIPPSQIIAYGESIGTGVSSELSKVRSLRGLILQSGFPSLTWAARDRLWFTWLYPTSWFPDLNCLSAVHGKHPPLLIIHGSEDEVFSPNYSKIIFARASQQKELCIIKGMRHCLSNSDEPEFQKALREFSLP